MYRSLVKLRSSQTYGQMVRQMDRHWINRQTYKQTDCHLDQDMFEGTFADAFAKKFHSSYEDAGCFETCSRPTMEQLYNKIHAVKKLLDKNPILIDTFQMRQMIEQHLEVPEDPHEAYIPFHEIQDEDGQNLRFNIIFSSSNCLSR